MNSEAPLDEARVLFVGKDESDLILVRAMLAEAHGPYAVDWAPTAERAFASMHEGGYQVFLLDCPTAADLSIIEECERRGYMAPFVAISSDASLDLDLAAMEAGASDFLVKRVLSPALLERALRYAIRRQMRTSELEALAISDPLTGLLNRRAFTRALEGAIDRADTNQHQVGVLYLDVDGLKSVNDAHGHAAGDKLLKGIANGLQQTLRNVDTLARLGGDEFAICLEGVRDIDAARAVAGKLICATDTPVDVDGESIHAGVSIGIAMFPANGRDTETLLSSADASMYLAKRRGGRRLACSSAPPPRPESSEQVGRDKLTIAIAS